MERLTAENQQLRRELLECRRMLQHIFIRNLIEDSINPIHTSNLDSQLEKNGIVLDQTLLLVCTLDILGVGEPSAARYPDSHEEFNNVCDTARLVCSRMLQVRYNCYSAVDGSEILLLVNLRRGEAPDPEEFQRQVAEVLRRALRYLQQDYDIFIAATVSQPTARLRDLTRIWRESRMLPRQNGAQPESRVFPCGQDAGQDSADRYRAYNDKQFYNAVLTGDFAQARALMAAYLDTFPKERDAMWELKSALRQRLITAVAICPTQPGGQLPVAPEIDTMLARCKTRAQLDTVLEHFFRSMAPEVSHLVGARTQRIRQYILENYENNQLSVELLCQYFGYSCSYLSHLYKQEQGESVVDTITQARVRQAKRLLHDPALSITAVAERVGYQSAWTLTRAFRRQDGITPAQYRTALTGG